MDSASRRILLAAIVEKRELVQMLYLNGDPDLGQREYAELRRLGQILRREINGDTGPDNSGTGENPTAR
jgi:hypothetical protein